MASPSRSLRKAFELLACGVATRLIRLITDHHQADRRRPRTCRRSLTRAA
jgi:hypothetical protein